MNKTKRVKVQGTRRGSTTRRERNRPGEELDLEAPGPRSNLPWCRIP